MASKINSLQRSDIYRMHDIFKAAKERQSATFPKYRSGPHVGPPPWQAGRLDAARSDRLKRGDTDRTSSLLASGSEPYSTGVVVLPSRRPGVCQGEGGVPPGLDAKQGEGPPHFFNFLGEETPHFFATLGR